MKLSIITTNIMLCRLCWVLCFWYCYVIILSVSILSIIMECHYGVSLWGVIMECHCGVSLWGVIMECYYGVSLWSVIMECHNGVSLWSIIMECHYAECRYDECHYAVCHYVERRGALPCNSSWKKNIQNANVWLSTGHWHKKKKMLM